MYKKWRFTFSHPAPNQASGHSRRIEPASIYPPFMLPGSRLGLVQPSPWATLPIRSLGRWSETVISW